jgi:hypothetical protein
MYNMEISIGSYKVRVIILIAIVVVFWIMFGHILCGCCRFSLFEGFKRNIKGINMKKKLEDAQKAQRDADEAKKKAAEAEAKAKAAIEKLR